MSLTNLLAQGRVPRGDSKRAPLRIPKNSVHARCPSPGGSHAEKERRTKRVGQSSSEDARPGGHKQTAHAATEAVHKIQTKLEQACT